MTLEVFVQKGLKIIEEINYLVVMNEDGEFAIKNKHLPIISKIDKGYLKIVKENETNFIFVHEGIITFKNQKLTCHALSAEIGKTLEDAKLNHDKLIHELTNLSKKENMDYSKLEKELRENIMSAGAGHL